ncbi:MAG: hypothetical protein R3258_08185 [Acidimicrobiia bacterium]|nr:hypothetical protein [Acidimicrobiia bacterium]
MFKAIFRAVRFALLAAFGAALVAKFMLESNAGPETEEIDLVAIFEGKELISTADPFYGGKVLSMFGGVMIDLRKATPSPTGVDLDVMIVMGGLQLIVPEGWRVRNNTTIFAGGLDDSTRTTADEDVPNVNLRGTIALGGVQIVTKSSLEAVA